MIVAGIGCRKGVDADAVGAAIHAACAHAGVATGQIARLATGEMKRQEEGIRVAASTLGVPLVLISRGDLERAGARSLSRSERVLALTGAPSLAESAALSAAGPGARLLGPRIALGAVTCALASDGAQP